MPDDKKPKDYKSAVHIASHGAQIKYFVIEEPQGPGLDWTMGVKIDGQVAGQGRAEKKRDAEHLAAMEALGWLELRRKERNRERGHAHQAYGHGHETLAVQALSDSFVTMPEWFRAVRLGTKEEDHLGIDVVIETHDLGDLLIQVKSSTGGAIKFEAKGRRSRMIGILIVAKHDEAPEVRTKLLALAEELRTAILERRGH